MNSDYLQKKHIEDFQSRRKKKFGQTRILIAESENELRLLFRDYFASLGMRSETANSGDEALDYFLQSKEKRSPYDAILVDTHLSNPSGLDVAKRIRSEKPDQKLVLVTTTPKEHLPAECLSIAEIKGIDILTMPFKLAKLVTVLKN